LADRLGNSGSSNDRIHSTAEADESLIGRKKHYVDPINFLHVHATSSHTGPNLRAGW